ncbi:MAG TPA: glutamate--tRNA ligase [Longimicrobiales bacterium]|nr:glutamate--tRNA ligase [Longimicrobiales bacterium]
MIRTRFAPSPTGSLHVGNARIAVLNWLFTRQQGGCFVLRIEDTDVERNVPGAEAGVRQDLLWLGLGWDEGPGQGPYGPYRQSERGPAYHRYAERLLESGHAYRCFCAADPTEDTLERRAPCECAALDAAVAQGRAATESHTLRFRVPAGQTIAIEDAVRGRVEFASQEIADFVLLRSDGRPTYNFAVVVDDIEMHISHVIRGVGHLSNTPRQVLLFDALDAARPVFAHVPMVLGPDRQKLSKRHGASGMAEYRAQGYHPDGLLNYLSLLSWSSPSGEDVLSREQLIEEISLERIGVADAMFDPARLRWLSAKHIERMPLPDLLNAIRPFVDRDRFDLDDDTLTAAVSATRTHFVTFADVNEQLGEFFPLTRTQVDSPVIAAALTTLDDLPEWKEENLRAALQDIGRASGVKGRALYEPLRRALTGREHGPPLGAVMFVQGRERVLASLTAAQTASDASAAREIPTGET